MNKKNEGGRQGIGDKVEWCCRDGIQMETMGEEKEGTVRR